MFRWPFVLVLFAVPSGLGAQQPTVRDSLAQLRDLARLLADQPEAVIYGTHTPKAAR